MSLNLPDFVSSLLRSSSRADEVGSLEVNMFSLNRKEDQLPSAMGRRSFLIAAGAAAAGLAYAYVQGSEPAHAAEATADLPKKVSIVEFSDSGQRKTVVSLPTVIKTEDQWRKQLSPDSFEVTRRAATELPYTNENPNEHAKGVFRCICCDTALFDSEHQVRVWYRLAKFLGADCERKYSGNHRQQFRYGANGSFLPPL